MSQSSPSPGLLGLAVLFSRIALAAILRALSYPFRSVRAPTLHRDVLFAAVRTMLQYITIPQSRYLNPSTTQRYLDYCSKDAVVPNSVHIDMIGGAKGEEVVAHWIGSSDADVVVLYLHGGGYTQPSTEGYYQYWHRIVRKLNGLGETKSIAVLQLAYTLAPEATYPTQLQEAATVLSHLLKEQGKPASNVILAGDSAGANLLLSLISHLLHPHPVVAPIKLDEPLRAALLFSPWVSFRTDFASFERNAEIDLLVPTMLRRWAAVYLGKSREDPESDPGPVYGDPYSDPLTNEAGWWSGMHRVVNDVLVLNGGDEVFADGITEFGRVFKKGWAEGGGDSDKVTATEMPRRAHIDPIMSVMVSPKGVFEDQLLVEEWLQARLAT